MIIEAIVKVNGRKRIHGSKKQWMALKVRTVLYAVL